MSLCSFSWTCACEEWTIGGLERDCNDMCLHLIPIVNISPKSDRSLKDLVIYVLCRQLWEWHYNTLLYQIHQPARSQGYGVISHWGLSPVADWVQNLQIPCWLGSCPKTHSHYHCHSDSGLGQGDMLQQLQPPWTPSPNWLPYSPWPSNNTNKQMHMCM